MRGSHFGKMLSFTSFGESHGPAMGVVVEGIPAGLEVSLERLKGFLKRRAPGRLKGTTSRKEEDLPKILSGVYQGITLGTPVAVVVENNGQKSEDYKGYESIYRPGHADKTTEMKFGFRDPRGGGRSSGRETVSRVIAGYFSSLIIPTVFPVAVIVQIGELSNKKGLKTADYTDYLINLKKRGESAGGKVRLLVDNVPPGLGEPPFDKLKADLSKSFMSIGACVGVNVGLGEDFCHQLGSSACASIDNFGGMEGGISNGRTIEMELWFRGPSTLGKKALEGRHDPCILPRVLPVVEAMSYIVLADHFLRQNAYDFSK